MAITGIKHVNAHDKLVEACRMALEDFQNFRRYKNPTIQRLREALAAAESSENSAGSPGEQRSTH